MLALFDQTHAPIVADEAEAVIARTAAERLRAVADAGSDVQITVDGKADCKIVVPLPARAVAVIQQILEAMANRTPMSLIPHDAELTTQQAADYLNVSRPYLIKRLEAGELDYRKVGSHRRIRFADLLRYEQHSREDQSAALAEMAEDTRRLGLE